VQLRSANVKETDNSAFQAALARISVHRWNIASPNRHHIVDMLCPRRGNIKGNANEMQPDVAKAREQEQETRRRPLAAVSLSSLLIADHSAFICLKYGKRREKSES